MTYIKTTQQQVILIVALVATSLFNNMDRKLIGLMIALVTAPAVLINLRSSASARHQKGAEHLIKVSLID